MKLLALLLLLLLPLQARATLNTDCNSTLATGQTTTGRSVNQLSIHDNAWRPSVSFQYFRNAGTATVQLEACCLNTCDPTNNAIWAVIDGSSKSIDGTTQTQGVGIDNPRCVYATNITACASCNVDVRCDVAPTR